MDQSVQIQAIKGDSSLGAYNFRVVRCKIITHLKALKLKAEHPVYQ